MSSNLKAQLDEVRRNIRITKKQIRKAKNGELSVPPGCALSIESPIGAALILEDQMRDLIVQEADIKRQIEELKECSEKN